MLNVIQRTSMYSLVLRKLLRDQLHLYNYENCEGCHIDPQYDHIDPQYDHMCLLGDEQAELEENYHTLMNRVQYSDYATECTNVFKRLTLPENTKDMLNMFCNKEELFEILLEDDFDSVIDTIVEKYRG